MPIEQKESLPIDNTVDFSNPKTGFAIDASQRTDLQKDVSISPMISSPSKSANEISMQKTQQLKSAPEINKQEVLTSKSQIEVAQKKVSEQKTTYEIKRGVAVPFKDSVEIQIF